MPEAVIAAKTVFAPREWGTYPRPGRQPVPQQAMDISHPTAHSLSRASARRSVRPARRWRPALVGVLAILVTLVGAAPAMARSSQYGFTVTGHGWGHGIGLSQWGAYGYAKHGWEYKAILKHYYTGISFTKAENLPIRVRLRSGLASVKVSCPNAYTVKGSGSALTIAAGTTATTTYTGSAYRVVAGSVRRDFNAAVTFTPTRGSLRLLTATDLGRTGTYRGTVKVMRNGSRLMMINTVPLESYLRGVVPHEVSPSWPAESLKAQAAAARAYCLSSRHPSQSWDVYCDVRSQAYAGVGIEDSRTDAAVKATAGVVPSYGGKPIMAFYFSCSGGHTENIELSWPNASKIPYLKGVSDPYDTYGTLHNWGPLRRTPSQLGRALGAKGSLRAVYRVKRGSSPRIVKAAVIGSRGTTYIDGSSLRVKLGLNSAWALFESMSISPAARDKVAVSAGRSVTLQGRMYPALKNGAKVSLRSYCNGSWHSRGVVTKRASQRLAGGYTARYSTYRITMRPSKTTKYYFSHKKAKSPVTTIAVR